MCRREQKAAILTPRQHLGFPPPPAMLVVRPSSTKDRRVYQDDSRRRNPLRITEHTDSTEGPESPALSISGGWEVREGEREAAYAGPRVCPPGTAGNWFPGLGTHDPELPSWA